MPVLQAGSIKTQIINEILYFNLRSIWKGRFFYSGSEKLQIGRAIIFIENNSYETHMRRIWDAYYFQFQTLVVEGCKPPSIEYNSYDKHMKISLHMQVVVGSVRRASCRGLQTNSKL